MCVCVCVFVYNVHAPIYMYMHVRASFSVKHDPSLAALLLNNGITMHACIQRPGTCQ